MLKSYVDGYTYIDINGINIWKILIYHHDLQIICQLTKFEAIPPVEGKGGQHPRDQGPTSRRLGMQETWVHWEILRGKGWWRNPSWMSKVKGEDLAERRVRTEEGQPETAGAPFAFHFLLTSVNVNIQGFPCFFTMSVLEPEILSCSLKQVTLRNRKISLPSKWSRELQRVEHPRPNKNLPGSQAS